MNDNYCSHQRYENINFIQKMDTVYTSKNLNDFYKNLSLQVQEKVAGRNSTDIAEELGITRKTVAKLRNGQQVGIKAVLAATTKYGLSLDQCLIQD